MLITQAQSITGAGLDSSITCPLDSHLTVLIRKSAGSRTDNPKTVVVVVKPRIVVVARGRAAIPGIVVPRTAPLWVPAPSLA